MSTMLATKNPQAADRIARENDPLPGVATMVRYHCRKGEMRSGRDTFPAIVMRADQGARKLKLIVLLDFDDIIGQDDVPEWVEGDRGWEQLATAGPATESQIRAELAAYKALVQNWLFGKFEPVFETSFMDVLNEFEQRISKLETAAPREPKPVKAKPQKPGKRAAAATPPS